MTRSELETLIKNTAQRDNDDRFGAAIPGFIERATERIGRDLRARENTATATLTGTGNTYALPSDFAEVISVTGPGPQGNEPLTAASSAAVQLGQNRQSQYPATYWISDGNLYTSPDSGGDLTLIYYQVPAELVNGSSQNAVLTAWGQLYLAASMVFAAQWTFDAEMVALWTAEYETEYQAINESRRQQQQPVSVGPYDYRGGTFAT